MTDDNQLDNQTESSPPSNLIFQIWLERDKWTDAEAACILSGIDPDSVRMERNYVTKSQCLSDGIAQKQLETIRSWRKPLGSSPPTSAHPFFYINKALIEDIHVPEELLTGAIYKFNKRCQYDKALASTYRDLYSALYEAAEYPKTNNPYPPPS